MLQRFLQLVSRQTFQTSSNVDIPEATIAERRLERLGIVKD